MNSTGSEGAILVVDQLYKAFPVRRSAVAAVRRVPGATLVAVDGVSLSAHRGSVVGLVGESGCGKTTLARCITRLVEPDQGSVKLDGTDLLSLRPGDLRRARRDIQMVFQDPYTSLNPRISIGDAIGEAARVHGVVPKGEVDAYVGQMLSLVGLPANMVQKAPRELSGGQRQRVAIARALAVKPKVLIADEPVSALDVSIQAQILNLLRELTDRLGLATVFIGHQLAVISHVADSVAVMYLGKIVEKGPADLIFGHPQHPYTRALLDSHPDPERELNEAGRKGSPPTTGDIPSPLNIPSGCRFRTRCAFAEDVCLSEPELVVFPKDQQVLCTVRPFSDENRRAADRDASV